MMTRAVLKAPTGRKLVELDWNPWLGTATIVSSSWTVPAGLTNDGVGSAAGVTSIYLKDGVLGTVYVVTNTILDTRGRQEDRSFEVSVLQT
jgi:hypothetical protein